jgi:transposase
MEEQIRMSIKEATRLSLMKQMDKENFTMKRLSEELGVTLRQAKRIRKRYRQQGVLGLVSQKRGRPSNRKISIDIRNEVLNLIQKHYTDFGPTLASEKLAEKHKICLSEETVRKWLIEAGLWQVKRRKTIRVYQRRQRRSRFGELLQGDGSPHDWFEGRAERCTLLQFVDDATGKTTAARFVPVETTEGYLEVLQEHLERCGRPLALYVDKHSTFRVNREEIKKGVGITHFGSVLKTLDIELICAHSPQAKGRVERKNGVFQDRLIKEMRLRNICSIEEGNAFLPEFLDEVNRRFGKEPAQPENAHRALRAQDDLKRIFARKDQRKLSKNLTFQHHGVLYMVQTKSPNRLKHVTVTVFCKVGGSIEIEYKGQKLEYKKWEEINYEQPKILDCKQIEISGWAFRKKRQPDKHHPWK